MSGETHGPFIACSGERPRVTLNNIYKKDPDKEHAIEGSRALYCENKASDLGTSTTNIEIISAVDLNDSFMFKIV